MATVNLGRVGLVLKGEWNSATQYTALDVVSHDGNAWAAKQNSTNVEPTTANSDFWQLFSNNADLVATVQGYKEDAASSAAAAAASAADAAADAQYGEDAFNAIAHTFDQTMDYADGKYVWYNGELYRFNAAHPAGAWIGTDAARYTATDELPLIQAKLTTLNNFDGGTTGQILCKKTNTDYDVEWADVGTPTDEQVTDAVDSWLDEHPEATTTVQDGSLTEAKFSESLKLLAIKDYLTPMMFSGYHGDGTTDDTAAMTACVAACGTQRKMLYIPKGKTVYIAQKTLFENQYLTEMLCYGTIKAPNGVEFRRSSSQTGGHWLFSNVDGELILSGIKNFLITIEKATKLTIFADSSITSAGSCAYNQFKLGYVETLLIDSLGTGWINENVFWGGRIKNLTISGNGSYPHNHNHFYNPTLEDGAALVVNKGFYNYFHNIRAEEGSANTFTFGASAYWNFIERTYVERPMGPGESGGFSGINDISHRNFYTTPGLPFFRIYERTCDWQSNNYNALFAHPEGKNLRVVTSASSVIINTKIIPIDRSLFVRMRCSETAFRYLIYAYDANQNPITTKPSVSPIIDALGRLSWSNDHYGISADRNSDRLEICRYVNGVDTGVCYVRISMYFPAGKNMLINLVDMRILCNRYLSPPQAIHFFKEERLTASDTPGSGDWQNGDIVWNTGTAVKCAGWFYQNSGWHPFGEYS